MVSHRIFLRQYSWHTLKRCEYLIDNNSIYNAVRKCFNFIHFSDIDGVILKCFFMLSNELQIPELQTE